MNGVTHTHSRANERYDGQHIWTAAGELRVGTKNSHSSGFYSDLSGQKLVYDYAFMVLKYTKYPYIGLTSQADNTGSKIVDSLYYSTSELKASHYFLTTG